MKDRLLERLRSEGLLQRAFVDEVQEQARDAAASAPDEHAGRTTDPASSRSPPPHLRMLQLCEHGALQGGLSVALGVRADELMGPLCLAIGGTAREVRVLDVRDRPVLELRIGYRGLDERWEIEDLYVLVHNLNDLLREDASARAVAVLGRWEDALQLWCVKKTHLSFLFRQDFFAPRNRHDLEAMRAR